MTAGVTKRIFAFYSRGEPALCYLFQAMAERYGFRAYWPADLSDLVRLAIGQARWDPNAPTPLPLLPWEGASRLRRYGPLLARRMRTGDVVIFTRPDQASLFPYFAKQRRIFYVLDDYRAYGRDWQADEIVLLKGCDRVVAVSPSLADLLKQRCPEAAAGMIVSPNAVPAEWIPPACPVAPADLPEGLNVPRPIAGVIGSISSRLRLDWLEQAAAATPWLHWLFVGGVEESELLARDKPILARLQARANCHFVGPRRYQDLAGFARALDVAIIPYSARSTNVHGSAMRLFLHLPFGQPIVATPDCAMVEDFAPLVTMCGSAETLVDTLDVLRGQNCRDGLAEQRWREAQRHSWTTRAQDLLPQLVG